MTHSFFDKIYNLVFGSLGTISLFEFLKESDNILLTFSSIAGSIYFLVITVGKYKMNKIERKIKEEELKKIIRENQKNNS